MSEVTATHRRTSQRLPRAMVFALSSWMFTLTALPASAEEPTAPAPAPAPAGAPESTSARQRVLALLGVSVNAAAKEQGEPVEALLASYLAEAQGVRVVSRADMATLLDVERQKRLLADEDAGCTDSCATDLAAAVGADLVLVSRLDRFGAGYVLTASLIDVERSESLARPHAEAAGDDALPSATRALSNQLLAALPGSGDLTADASRSSAAPSATGSQRRFLLGLKVGNTLLTQLAGFNLAGDLQLGYHLTREWVAFVQVGFALVQGGRLQIENVALVPSLVGVRHLYRLDHAFQPYWGLGLGVQVNLNSRFKFVQNHGVLPAVHGMGGFQYLLTPRFGVGVEASMNLAGTVVELATNEELRALNVSLQGVVNGRF